MKTKIMTPKQYAAHRKISQQAVSKYIRQGKLDGAWTIDSDGKYMIDRKQADALLQANLAQGFDRRRRTTRQKTETETVPDDLLEKLETIKSSGITAVFPCVDDLSHSQLQKLNLLYKNSLLKLEYDQKQGALIEKAKVMHDLTTCHVAVRNKIMGIHDRIGQRLGAEAAIIAKEVIWTCLTELSEMTV